MSEATTEDASETEALLRAPTQRSRTLRISVALLFAIPLALMFRNLSDDQSVRYDAVDAMPDDTEDTTAAPPLKSLAELLRFLLPPAPFGHTFRPGDWSCSQLPFDDLHLHSVLADLPLQEQDGQYIMAMSKNDLRRMKRQVHQQHRKQLQLLVSGNGALSAPSANTLGWMGNMLRSRGLFGRHVHRHGGVQRRGCGNRRRRRRRW